jgi:hypothetical protein
MAIWLAIKAVAKRPWGQEGHRYRAWYEPFDTQEEIDKSRWYTLSQGITTMPLASDVGLWDMIFSAVKKYHQMVKEEQGGVISESIGHASIFPIA